MPMGSFSRYIRKRLELTYPNNRIEVVNIGLTAVNSYTVRDFMPGVLEQKPDLILIYTGHNEYYGALGVGSLESLGSSRMFVNLILNLNKFKTTQLLRDLINWLGNLISSSQPDKSGTLMSRMAKEQTIPIESDNYKAGIEQFKGNIRDVIEMAKDANVPIILGTLVSNLKDQEPFISVKGEKYLPAKNIFNDAQISYNSGNYKIADSLFRLAKDLDALRFRAPEEINRTIKNIGSEFSIPIVDIDSLFNAVSPNGIVGNNLMTDHLHPTLHGYQIIGKIFFEEMAAINYLPKNSTQAIPFDKQNELTIAQFPFSPIDSTIALYRIKLLKNDWPYIDPRNKIPANKLITPKTFEDTLAYKCVTQELSWADSHQKAVDKFLSEKRIDAFLEELGILIYQYPIVVEYYGYIDNLGLNLLQAKDFYNAYKVFLKRYQLQPNDLSTKWLGTIDLNSSRIPSAIRYLEESVKLNSNDLQTLYNLAGAYALNKDYKKSFDTISKVLNSDPNYPGAQALLQQLRDVLKF
jgi:tetratricopeptide (TPR) repeat protein